MYGIANNYRLRAKVHSEKSLCDKINENVPHCECNGECNAFTGAARPQIACMYQFGSLRAEWFTCCMHFVCTKSSNWTEIRRKQDSTIPFAGIPFISIISISIRWFFPLTAQEAPPDRHHHQRQTPHSANSISENKKYLVCNQFIIRKCLMSKSHKAAVAIHHSDMFYAFAVVYSVGHYHLCSISSIE